MTSPYDVTVRDPSDAVFARPEAEVHSEFKKVIHQAMREGTAALLADFYVRVAASGDVAEMRKAIQMGITATGAEAAKAVDPYSGLATINITVNHGVVNMGAVTAPAGAQFGDVRAFDPNLDITDAVVHEKAPLVRPWTDFTQPTPAMLRNYMVNMDVADFGLADLVDL